MDEQGLALSLIFETDDPHSGSFFFHMDLSTLGERPTHVFENEEQVFEEGKKLLWEAALEYCGYPVTSKVLQAPIKAPPGAIPWSNPRAQDRRGRFVFQGGKPLLLQHRGPRVSHMAGLLRA